jgi:nitroimidazol reductase NimA-like FMN-containing flavoprotein (pyridoxamine 5'-phosphate oxidase superfamily)
MEYADILHNVPEDNVRRKDKEILNIDEKINIIIKCKVCRLGLSENNEPYIIPLNYGYSFENNILTLFFHSAKEGRKNNIMKINNNACFEIDCDNKLIEGEKACNYGYAFKSIIGFGEIIILENNDEKIKGLNYIMKHQTEKEIIYNFTEEELRNVIVYKMNVKEFTGKQKEFPIEK